MFKRIYYILSIGLLVASCSEDVMDDISKDVNNPTVVATKYTLTDVMTVSAFSVTGSDLAFYSSCFIEHNVGVYGQLYDAENRLASQICASSTYNNSWNSIYRNLNALKIVINKCSEGGDEVGNTLNLGIAQVLTAYNLAVLTDVFGDVPWSEALQPGVIYQPKLDKQQAIYDSIFNLIDRGIVNLGKATTFSNIGSQDIIYGGKAAAWIKSAYGLKARYTLRLSLRTPNYAKVIEYADKSFANADEELKFAAYDGSTAVSPFYAFFTDRDYFGASQSLNQKLVDRNDPRVATFFEKYPDTDALIFAPNGNPGQKQKYYGISKLTSPTAPTYMLSYHELLFLKAEAYARNSDLVNAEIQLQNAIKASFVKVGLTEAAAQAYYNSDIKAKFTANALLEIAIQKYIAFYQDEALEAYNDYRRQAAMGTVIPLSSTLVFPQRFTYGVADVTTNNNVKEAYGDGTYVKTVKVWWAGGTR